MTDFQQACATMINQQLRTNGISHTSVLDVIRSTPREQFVPRDYYDFAYADFAIPLAHQQQMWIPELEAQVLQALEIQPTDHILEIGTGSGYFTALLAQFGEKITSVDIFQDLVDQAAHNPWFKNYHHLTWICANYANGPESKNETYDVIVITGALPSLPPPFLNALNAGGRMVALLGKSPTIEVILFTKTADSISQYRITETNVPTLLQAEHLTDNFKF